MKLSGDEIKFVAFWATILFIGLSAIILGVHSVLAVIF